MVDILHLKIDNCIQWFHIYCFLWSIIKSINVGSSGLSLTQVHKSCRYVKIQGTLNLFNLKFIPFRTVMVRYWLESLSFCHMVCDDIDFFGAFSCHHR